MRVAASVAATVVSLVAGTMADGQARHEPVTVGGYRVLQVDFHTHSSTWSDGVLTPFGMVLEARARGLDGLTIAGHNQIWDSYAAHWFARVIGGPIVLRGQEVLSPTHHIIAAGITETIDYLQNAADTIADIHRQGGIAIAAHPAAGTDDYDAAAVTMLDGAEICHPIGYVDAQIQHEFEQFRARGTFAAIGSSDFHGLGPMGSCRTYVFVRDVSEHGILEAVRARRTVVFAPEGRIYGDAELLALAAAAPGFGESLPARSRSAAQWVSGAAAVIGLRHC
jgi:predicted metal-dependent phosphoesterase TrpH